MLSKLFTKLKHFVIFSIRRDKMIPLLKRPGLPANRRIAKYNQHYTLHYEVYCLVVRKLSIYRF